MWSACRRSCKDDHEVDGGEDAGPRELETPTGVTEVL
jgi:hypothetical protein